ncbi:hypothetical protein [Paenibacillus sp. DYY-L-2]|uniref:hypothetical protein n=1 Tax=Paenibacillus sp. DYY-L-2 TaxID=3447013 RepID=UPI003F5048E1
MSKVVFWDYGHGGAAEMAASCAICMALTDPGRVLLFNEEPSGTGVETGFFRRETSRLPAPSPAVETGREALLRLAANHRLTKANFIDYTHPILKGRMDLVRGGLPDGGPGSAVDGNKLDSIYRVADQVYDWIFTRSLSNPISDQGSNRAGESREIRIAVLRQNRAELERFFEGKAVSTGGEPSLVDMIVFDHYDPSSHWSAGNIRRRFNCSVPIYTVPYSTAFRDAWNDAELLRNMRLHRLKALGKPERQGTLPGIYKVCEGLRGLAGGKTSRSHSGKGA